MKRYIATFHNRYGVVVCREYTSAVNAIRQASASLHNPIVPVALALVYDRETGEYIYNNREFHN